MAPLALVQLWEFALHFVGRTPFISFTQSMIADRKFRRNRHEHMNMIGGKHAADDVDTILAANLATGVRNPQAEIALQRFVAILG